MAHQGARIKQLVSFSMSSAVSGHTVGSQLCSVLLACCSCLVDTAFAESGDCSDVWNVWHSSTHNTKESRSGTCVSIRLISFQVVHLFWVMSRFV